MPTAMATIEHATQLLDFTQKLDITLLDSVVSCFYMAQGPQVHTYFPFILWLYHVQILEMAVWLTDYFSLHQQRMADQILTQLKQHPDAWTRVDTILEFSNNQQTKVGFNIWIFHKIYNFLSHSNDSYSSISRSKYSNQSSRRDGKFFRPSSAKVSQPVESLL